MIVMTEDDHALARRFERATLESLSHRDHVRLAWIYLQREPLWSALPRFCADLRRFATQAGAPGRYHETISWAYLLLIHERRQRRPEDETWEAFAAANADLVARGPSVLDRYYHAETLDSDRARAGFVLPDRLLP
jgi:hypothetical protein